MAQHTVGGTDVFSRAASHAPSLRAVLALRLTSGLVALLGALISFFGTSWDIQWHVFIGRDRTLIPPHEMMLTGITLGGIAALTDVITETIWARRHQNLAQQITPFAGLFSAPLGAYIVGYAALCAAVAFPLDTYWHTLYGIDVSLWAPFHIMIISGMALMAFGAVYLLASAGQVAARLHTRKAERSASIGTLVAFATSLSLFTLLVAQGSSPDRSVSLGFASFNLFPVLSALLLGWMLVGAAYTLPWKWAATGVIGVSFLFVLIDQIAVPPAITWLMQIEQLTFRRVHHLPRISVVAVVWPLLSLVSALLIDVCVQRARQKGWSARQLFIGLALAALVGGIPLTVEGPVVALSLVSGLGVLGTLLSLAIGGLGGIVGTKLGQSVGETTHALEG